MSDEATATKIDSTMLAAAFPPEHGIVAMTVATEVVRHIDRRYWRGQFDADVGNENLMIPVRLHFTSNLFAIPKGGKALLFVRALQTRSTDGFERQRAARDLLENFEPWSAPYIVALIGGYIIEILEDIAAAMTSELEQALGAFIVHNEGLWKTTRSRVVSYWNAYYRSTRLSETGRGYRRDEYVGFRLTDRLEAAAFGRAG